MTAPVRVPDPFRVDGPLPTGTVLLEASAGTGKTFAVAALAARYVVEEGIDLGELMIVTFSEASSRELRRRVRQRLVEVAAALTAELEGPTPTNHPDPVLAVLCEGDRETLKERRRRTARALSSFDAATICTTHQFCDRMLSVLGIRTDHDPGTARVADVDQLTRQATADEFVRRYAGLELPLIPYLDAVATTRSALASPAVDLAPPLDAELPTGVAERVAFVDTVRRDVERRKRVAGVYTFDDMLLRLRDALVDPATGAAAARRLADRYPVVLVDEFQDTDPVQWEILTSAFVGTSTVVLIGDPKQSIYGFRGADIHAYLAAREAAQEVATLDTNRRSSPAMVLAVGTLLNHVGLGEPEIVVHPVQTSDDTPILAFQGSAPWRSPVRLRVPSDADSSGQFTITEARELVTRDLVADVSRLLSSGAVITEPDGPVRGLQSSDVAVIVSTNRRGQDILDALGSAGVPAVFTGARSVFSSRSAHDLLKVLRAMERTSTSHVRTAALTNIVGWSLPTLVAADEDALAELSQTIRAWARTTEKYGIAAAFEVITSSTDLVPRLLGRAGGERIVTDVRHLVQLLDSEQSVTGLGIAGLIEWLTARIASNQGVQQDDRSRRLETDGQAVQIMTVHQAKGLQFAVVYLPEVATRFHGKKGTAAKWGAGSVPETLILHDQGRRLLDVGGDRAPGRSERRAAHEREEAGETLRGLYVALTRAACHVTAWWVPVKSHAPASPLHRVLFRDPGSVVPSDYTALDSRRPAQVIPAGFGIVVEPMPPAKGTDIAAPPPARHGDTPPTLRAFSRAIDHGWTRTSYSAITADAHHELAPSLEEIRARDEPDLTEADDTTRTIDADQAPGSPADLDVPSPMAELPGGVGFGSLVHAVFEHHDPQSTDRRALEALIAHEVARMPVPGVGVEKLAEALEPGLHTPLGPLADGRSLAEIPPRDRLVELDFELPLGTADGRKGAGIADIADVLAAHLAPDDPLVDYPQRLRGAGLSDAQLRGFLTGSIDAVLRVVTDDRARFLVVDYKTNRLAPLDTPLTLAHYTRTAMAEAMMASHYPLQALLYAVALHRMLRWRLAGYDPQQHLGGVGYLFVRGMAGPDTPLDGGMPTGVFGWQPDTAIVTALSGLLATGAGR